MAIILGNDLPNTLIGTNEDDVIFAFGADDFLRGNDGNDILHPGDGEDIVEGNDGYDFVAYSDATSGVTVNLADNTQNAGAALGDLLFTIEGVIGSNFADTLIGNGADNILRGGRGGDALDGAGGTDHADYRDAAKGIVASLIDPSANTGEAAGDSYDSIEGLIGSAFDDTLIGDGGDNILRGGGGSDVLVGGPGADELDGGGGSDFASYSSSGGGVTVSLANPSQNSGDAFGDTFVSIENLIGSAFDDRLTGNGSSNRLIGGDGADVLAGKGGFDFASYSLSARGVRASLDDPSLNTHDAAGDTYSSIEGLIGSAFGDRLYGKGGANKLFGERGADFIYGGAGADRLYGDAAGDRLYGGKGNDRIYGGKGNDTIDGGAGKDYAYFSGKRSGYTIDIAGGKIIVKGADGTDRLTGVEFLVFDDATVGIADMLFAP